MKTVDRAKIWAYNTRYTENEEEAYDIIGDLLKERQYMLDALEKIALVAPATVCNTDWIASHAIAAIAKARGEA